MSDTTKMTAQAYEQLQTDIEALEGEKRRELAERIGIAREWGDLKENGEYHAAKEAQGHLETRIALLRERMLTATIVEATSGDVAGFGSTVSLDDEQTGKRMTYKLVSSHEASAAQGLLSVEGPMGTALQGRRAGDIAVIQTPGGERRMKVVAVE